MKKWILILLIITAAVVWMGACGAAPEPEVVVVEEPTEAEEPAEEEPMPEQEVIQVVVWATNDYEEEAYYVLRDRFEEANPDIRVELTVYR